MLSKSSVMISCSIYKSTCLDKLFTISLFVYVMFKQEMKNKTIKIMVIILTVYYISNMWQVSVSLSCFIAPTPISVIQGFSSSEYNQQIPQSHTTGQPSTSRAYTDPKKIVRGSPNLTTFFWWERGSNTIIRVGPISGTLFKWSLAGESKVDQHWTLYFVIFRGQGPVLQRNPIFFVIIQGGWCPDPCPTPPPFLIPTYMYIKRWILSLR